MTEIERIARDHADITRRYFIKLGTVGMGALSLSPLPALADSDEALLAQAISTLEYLTQDEDFINFGRGDPPPHTLPQERLREEGLTQNTWQLEVLPDPDSNAQVERPLSRTDGTALDWQGLMTIAAKKAVRFMSVMSCTNGSAPCGMGLWEGVPLRDVIWMARPTGNVRRAFYYGFHNHDPEQRFQGSLPIGRILEDPPGEHPVILCTKLNNQWLSSKRGGPVRMIVPEDPYFTQAPWQDAEILAPPRDWGGGLPDGKLPPVPKQIDRSSGKPLHWPLPNSIVHWATLIHVDQPGKYDLRCRTIDRNGVAQPMPRPFPKSGNNRIKREKIVAV